MTDYTMGVSLTDKTPTSLTSGSILFINSNLLSQDNNNLYWDNINKRMGIGTNAPAQGLHVNGNIRVNNTSQNIFSNIFTNLSTTANLQLKPNQVAVDLRGTSSKGVIFDTHSTTSKNNISSPVAGQCVYDTDLNKLCIYTGSAWETITSA